MPSLLSPGMSPDAKIENYVIGDAKKVVDYETSAKGAVQFVPYKGAQRVYHTNHPVVSDDFIPGYPTIAQESINRVNCLKYQIFNFN
ncbi:MAG: hypothetical protein JRJ37_09555 [Deltaproteobacteria bacterium]|nr:hypothetical protein [Deltaproteobacteria bacterium]